MVFGPTLSVKLIMFDDTDLYQIRYTGASNFEFKDNVCEKRMRI
jgi:hypothetical protein